MKMKPTRTELKKPEIISPKEPGVVPEKDPSTGNQDILPEIPDTHPEDIPENDNLIYTKHYTIRTNLLI